MLLDRRLATVVSGLLAVSTVSAACTDLLIDDFSKWVEGTNNLNWPNGGQSLLYMQTKQRNL